MAGAPCEALMSLLFSVVFFYGYIPSPSTSFVRRQTYFHQHSLNIISTFISITWGKRRQSLISKMKRARSIRSHCSQRESIAIPYTVTEGEYGIPYELMPPTTRLITPPPEDNRPSKVRRHGSRFLHALKSLTNSGKHRSKFCVPYPLSHRYSSFSSPCSAIRGYGSEKKRKRNQKPNGNTDNNAAASSTSQPEQLITPPQSPTASTISTNPSKRDPISFMKSLQMAPTVVHRQPTKPRVTLRSLEKSALELTAEASPATSSGETSGNSGKSSAPGNSTGKTSLDSKFSSPAKVLSGHFSENKKGQGCLKVVGLEDSCELSPIHEGVVEVTPQPIPSKFISRVPFLACLILCSCCHC